MPRAAVIYYSFWGHTETAAKAIADHLNAPLMKIEETGGRKGPVGIVRGAIEALLGASSEIKPLAHLTDYDTLFLGSPIWAFSPSPAMNSFIKNSELNGKQVILFLTHTSSNPKRSVQILAGQIKTKGGKVVKAFGIKTTSVKNETIIKEALKIAEAIG